MEIWQQNLLEGVNYLNFTGNKDAIKRIFKKECEPITGYDGYKFEDDTLTINNKTYKLEVKTNSISINFSDGMVNKEYKFLAEKSTQFNGLMKYSYYIDTYLYNSCTADNRISYENIICTLLEMIGAGY